MPRAPATLPEEFEEDQDTKRIRCKVCLEGDITGLGSWMHRGSWRKHLESTGHQAELCRKTERDMQKTIDAERLAELRRAPETSLPTFLEVIHSTRQTRAQMFSLNSSETAPDRNSESTGMESQVSFNSEFDMPIDAENLARPSNPLIPAYMDPDIHDPDAKRRHLEELFRTMLLQAEHEDEFGAGSDEDDEDFRPPDSLREEGDPVDPEEIANYFSSIASDADYFPYPNKILMMLDVLDNLPRLRVSSNLMRMFLWILRECGIPNVPSYDSFRKMQTELSASCGNANGPVSSKSMFGNVFYVNDIRGSIAQDFANPEVAKHLQFYPEETKGPISEVWQAERWKEFKPSELTPMYARGHRQFYIEEICQLWDGRFVIPHDWVIRDKVLTAQCTIVMSTKDGWRVCDDPQVITASSFQFNYFDVVTRLGSDNIEWKEGTIAPEMPNPLRKIAKDKNLYVIMVPLWCDDVSGNKSKQYNKHINMYTVNSNIPGQLLQQEYFVRFVSASQHASAPEQFSVLQEQINATHTNPIECFNAASKDECAVILRVPGLPADNPQQSEEASHMGANANCACRKCNVGGSHEFTESDTGYHSLHKAGVLRSADETRQRLEEQLYHATYGIEKRVTDLQTKYGTKDKITQYWINILLQKAREIKANQPGRPSDSISVELRQWLSEQPGDKMNPLLTIDGLDPTQDTPVEILHTILLGIMKYVWHMLNLSWSDADRAQFAIRLQSIDLNGMTVPPVQAAYMVQYRNNLIGKHFKTLMQTLAFVIHGMVTPQEFALVKAVGELGAVLWVHEIHDMELYLDDLDILVANVLDAFGDIQPTKIVLKIKLHLLVHLREDIRRFGPAIRNSTEVFECFNAVFRLCSIYSNHQAASRDIARKFLSLDRIKHILSGGYWKQDGSWVQAGKSVLRVLHHEPIIQRHLGWVPIVAKSPGYVRTVNKKIQAVKWNKTLVSQVLRNPLHHRPEDEVWRMGVSVVSQAGDICGVKSWIVFRTTDVLQIGRIAEIVVAETTDHSRSLKTSYVTLDTFILAEERHPQYGLPFLRRPEQDSRTPKYQVIQPKDIQFIISVQHDCQTAKCEASGSRTLVQERQASSRTEKLIKHSNDDLFIANLYTLHNATLIRRILPRDLVKPKPIYPDAERQAHHASIAAGLRVTQTVKRARTQEKRKATLAAKQAEKRKRAEQLEGSDEESEDGIGRVEVEDISGPSNKRHKVN